MWKRRRSATATAEEFVDARTLFIQIHEDAEWNPWVLDDRAPEIERAMAVMRQWQRAEPGFRLRQLADVKAELTQEDEERAAQIADERQARERRKADYDSGLEQARLVLLELEGWLAMERFQRQGLIEETLLQAWMRVGAPTACGNVTERSPHASGGSMVSAIPSLIRSESSIGTGIFQRSGESCR